MKFLNSTLLSLMLSAIAGGLVMVVQSEAAQQTAGAPKTPAAPTTVPTAPVVTPPPVGNDPELTTAIYGDWVLRCQATAQQKRACEIASIISAQGQSSPIAQLVISKGSASDGRKIIMLLPVNIRFAVAPKIAFAQKGTSDVELQWLSCAPGACMAIANLSDASLTAMQSQTELGHLVFHDSSDREIAISASFRGLTQAVAALNKE